MVTFQFLDWLWVALFVLIMVGAGVLFYRLGKRSESDFFLAGRGLPWWLPASSVYATHTATDTPIWVTGVIYKYGFMGIWYTFFSAWCAISAFVSTRIFRRSLAYTQAEWNTLRFGGLGAEMLRGWISGWQVFMNMFILGWVGIAMGKVCGYLFGWDEWIGLTVFSTICALYVLSAGYWGVIMADFQQGVIAFAVIIIVSIWGIIAAGGPSGIIEKLDSLNSTSYWQVPESINSQTTTKLRILNSETNKIISKNNSFVISSEIDTIAIYEESKNKINILANDKNQQRKEDSTIILFPSDNDILIPGHEYLIVWVPLLDDSRVNLEYSTDNGSTWKLISEYNHDGQSWRIDPFAFTSWFGGDFPFAWFITMLVIALIGGFGMGTSIDWYAEAQRIQSAKTVRDSSYSIWWGTA
ncbi:MAG: hypothetical protein JW866_10550, partial [Ignavibacteriales bacterium]|nr:hypothetical protein [Ignavibacteriales bacterium]